MERRDRKAAFALVERGFERFVRSDFTKRGIDEFLRAAREIIFHTPDGHRVLVADADGEVVGIVDVRDDEHICLFFVEPSLHRRGIGRRLLTCAIDECHAERSEISVNSSLYAAPVYRKLGFSARGGEQLDHGIRYIRMTRKLKE
jgi:GNAT superfamily N-acetyltransferase